MTNIAAFGPVDFGELLDATVPWKDGTFVMMRAYIDASRRNSGVSCVAGVAFGIDRAKKAERAWRSIFGERRCHMTDLHARQGAFKGITDEEAGELCHAAIAVINQYASLVVAVSCDDAEVERLRPREARSDSVRLLDSARSAYTCGLHWAMSACGIVLADSGRPQQLQYWFERGDQFQGAARQFLAAINEPAGAQLRRHYCYGSDAFVDKADAHLFDTADVVAWEWGKHVERLRNGIKARPSLLALMDGGPCVALGRPFHRSAGRYANHYTGAPLERYFKKMGGIFTAASAAELDEIVRA